MLFLFQWYRVRQMALILQAVFYKRIHLVLPNPHNMRRQRHAQLREYYIYSLHTRFTVIQPSLQNLYQYHSRSILSSCCYFFLFALLFYLYIAGNEIQLVSPYSTLGMTLSLGLLKFNWWWLAPLRRVAS